MDIEEDKKDVDETEIDVEKSYTLRYTEIANAALSHPAAWSEENSESLKDLLVKRK
jgi:hypothetical protein